MRRSIYNIIKTTHINLLDQIVGLFAPLSCLGCNKTGAVLCDVCLPMTIYPPPPRCFGCQKVSKNYKTCMQCKRYLNVDSVLCVGPYDGIHKQLVMSMKKDASRSAAIRIGDALALLINEHNMKKYDYIISVPTITKHVRERGFNHTKMVARHLAQTLNTPYKDVLRRKTSTRQVGKTRQERFKQMENTVLIESREYCEGAKVLLVDDIATTGATLSACSQVLKMQSVKQVDAVVFASGN